MINLSKYYFEWLLFHKLQQTEMCPLYDFTLALRYIIESRSYCYWKLAVILQSHSAHCVLAFLFLLWFLIIKTRKVLSSYGLVQNYYTSYPVVFNLMTKSQGELNKD